MSCIFVIVHSIGFTRRSCNLYVLFIDVWRPEIYKHIIIEAEMYN